MAVNEPKIIDETATAQMIQKVGMGGKFDLGRIEIRKGRLNTLQVVMRDRDGTVGFDMGPYMIAEGFTLTIDWPVETV